MEHPAGSEKLYTSALLTKLPEASMTRIWYWVPAVPAPVVGPMM